MAAQSLLRVGDDSKSFSLRPRRVGMIFQKKIIERGFGGLNILGRSQKVIQLFRNSAVVRFLRGSLASGP